MFIYGKTAANAVAIMSYLAAEPERQAGSAEIAASREISRALTAKLLTQLSTAGLVTGLPGPGGGYRLARSPENISLLQIVQLFEQTDAPFRCPFGQNWCGKGEPCPLHDKIVTMNDNNRAFLENTKLDVFIGKNRLPQNHNKPITALTKKQTP